jgi:thiamine biosynthesis lipoprotein
MIDPRSDNPADEGSAPALPVQRFQHDAMACTFELILPGVDARYAAQAAFDEIDRLEQLLSRFIPHSDVARINTLAAGQSVRVSPETAECLQLAAQVYTATRGAFDIAYRRRRQLPVAADGWPASPLVFDPAACAVGVQVAGVDLDLGAIGKGYAVDRVVTVLREWHVPAALVHSGQSTVYAVGQSPSGDSWRVALRSPDQSAAALGFIELRDVALSGSGQLLHGGHIVDPRTGQPAERFTATWAIAPDAALSDALSTAFMLMSAEEVRGLCEHWPGVSAILLPAGGAAQEAVCFGPLGRSVQWSTAP